MPGDEGELAEFLRDWRGGDPGALTTQDAADVLQISLATAERDLKLSRSWLLRALSQDAGPAGG